jgi:hypothetical protein
VPTYRMINKETKIEFIEEMRISDFDEYMKEHPELDCIPGTPLIGYDDRKRKPSQGFRDRLKEIKRSHHGSVINTF